MFVENNNKWSLSNVNNNPSMVRATKDGRKLQIRDLTLLEKVKFWFTTKRRLQ